MPSVETFNLEEYFNDFADRSAVLESNRFKTVPTGRYTLQVTKTEGRKYSDNRPLVHCTATIYGEGEKKLGTVFFDMSWVPARDKKGNLDSRFRLWTQAVKAMFPDLSPDEQASKPIGDVLNAIVKYPMKAFISESFQVTEDGVQRWSSPRSDEETVDYKTKGYESRNFVQSLSKV
jgi:hypothetical protein